MTRRFSVRAVLQGFAYRLRHHPSFYVSVVAHLICATATVGFILAFIQQASFTGNTRRFNIVIIAALLGAVLFASCFIILARIIAVRTSFNTIPKPYIPTKHIDVPRKVAEHITREYTRTGVIAYISQPTAGKQEGWGRPGTQFASIHFRTSIRETFHAIREPFFTYPLLSAADPPPVKTLDDLSPHVQRLDYPPYAIRQITSHPYWPRAAQPLLEMYEAIFTKAKYARSEPDAAEYERCIKIVALIMGLIKTSHQPPADLPETPARRDTFVVAPDNQGAPTTLVSSPVSMEQTQTFPGNNNERPIQSVPAAHLAPPHEISSRKYPTYPPPQGETPRRPVRRARTLERPRGESQSYPRRRGTRNSELLALFDEEGEGSDRPVWSSSSSSSNEEKGNQRRVEEETLTVPEPALDLHQPRTGSLPSRFRGDDLPRSRRESGTVAPTSSTGARRLSLLFPRHHHPESGDTHPHPDSRFGVSLSALPRARRRGTTRYRGSDGEDELDGAGNGTAGFLHTVWGAGRTDGE